MTRNSGNYMKGSNRSQMGSNATTDVNQGGGNKKAGFPYQIGREYRTSIALGCTAPLTGNCCSLKQMNTLPNGYRVIQSRSIGTDQRIRMR